LPDFEAGAIEDRFFGDVELFQHARELFVRQTRQGLADAVGMSDGQALSRLAHRIRGSAATLGAATLAAVCQRLEDEGEGLAPEQMQRGVEEALARFEGFVTASQHALAAA
jgi:HPt (histidine-containing phosphotransfer) domain-containing protein